MKRMLSVLLIFVLLIGVVACGNKEKPNDTEVLNNSGDQVEDKPIIKYFNEEDFDKFAATQTIVLPEDTTKDGEWIYIVDNAEVVELVRDEFVYDEGVDALDGGKGKRFCELKGISSGEAIVCFSFLNPLAESIEPEEEVQIFVEVNENNEIAVTAEIH